MSGRALRVLGPTPNGIAIKHAQNPQKIGAQGLFFREANRTGLPAGRRFEYYRQLLR